MSRLAAEEPANNRTVPLSAFFVSRDSRSQGGHVRTSHRWLAVGVVAFSLAAACGGDGTGPGGGGGGGGGSAAFSANIDGQAWATDAARLQIIPGSASIPGSLLITGTQVSGNNVVTIQLFLGYIGAAGSYRLGVNQISTPGGLGSIIQQSGTTVENRMTPFDGFSGTVVITSLTATRIVGHFGFVAQPLIGSSLSGNRTITDGSFDLALPSGFTSVPTANHGSTISATLGGIAWNGATVLALGSNGVFVGGGQTTSRSVQLQATTPLTTPGSYNLHGGVDLSIVDLSNGHSWGGSSGDVGTVVFTSLADGRVVGTFSGTLQPGAATTGTLVVTEGTFDIRIDAP